MDVGAPLKEQLIAFERDVADRFEHGLICGPVHLSSGNEEKLIELFQSIRKTDYVFSTWRSHYHALLHGVPADKVMGQITMGRSMNLIFPEHNFYTSAIVGGILPIAVGVAYGIQGKGGHVWCFVGDMTAKTGIFHECRVYAGRNDLPITFVVEDNKLSCNTPTETVWGGKYNHKVVRYDYERTGPHCGIGKWVTF